MKGSESREERKRQIEKGYGGTREREQRDHKDRKRSQVPSQPKDKSSSWLILHTHTHTVCPVSAVISAHVRRV